MEEINDRNNTPQDWSFPPEEPIETKPFPTGKKEGIFGLLTLVFGLLLCNSIFFGGFSLGFGVFTVACTLCGVGYLLSCGYKLKAYPAAILSLCLVIAAAYARTDDSFVKFVMTGFLAGGINLGLCLLAGQNRWSPNGVTSLLDAPRTAFLLGFGRIPESASGVRNAFRRGGGAVKKGGAVLLGLGIAFALLCVMIPLLTSADAAFAGIIRLLPRLDVGQVIATLILGAPLVGFLYSRCVALRHWRAGAAETASKRKRLPALTVNTVLAAVAAVYLVYVFSQLTYLSGGFAGILPQGFTRAEYARRGFFEMAVLCAINLGLIALAVGLVEKNDRAPASVRVLCLFIGAVTLFLVATASAKMVFYIGQYGLTRLRVLTEVVTLFFGIATVLVMVWLFAPKLPYMKGIILAALIIGAVVIWADVDTVVAHYNVTAYQSGQLETVDVEYLAYFLGDGAVPYLVELTEDPNAEVAGQAKECLKDRETNSGRDLRGWNYVNQVAKDLLETYL